MKNKIKYSKLKSRKYIANTICKVAMSGTIILATVMLSSTPLVTVDESSMIKEESVETEVSIKQNETVIVSSAGVAKAVSEVADSIEIEKVNIALSGGAGEKDIIIQNLESKKKTQEVKAEVKEEPDVIKIRCTGYDDVGYTKSGEWTREGVIAGKEEWLHKKCKLYRINEDGSVGELIGEYTFLDTGYGIKTKTANGVQGSLKLGTSIDVWHPSEASIWEWMDEYGDYVYMEGPY